MYSVVLATMMTLTPAAPDWGFGWGCHGCHGCYGCYGCCGCYGCYGGYGCCGCYGCYGCYGCCGCYGYTCHGCYGCCGCYGYTPYYPSVAYYPSCCGGAYVAPTVVVPANPKLPPPPEKKDKDEVSTVRIKAPADVRLTVDGQPFTLSGTAQTFETPKLKAGHTYSYVFRAEGKLDGKAIVREQTATVRAGETVQVDFSKIYANAAARVTIVLPSDAKLIVENMTMPEGAKKRTFETPELKPGRHYSYTMRAEVKRDGKMLQEEKQVEVEAGSEVTVEFKDLPPLQSAQR